LLTGARPRPGLLTDFLESAVVAEATLFSFRFAEELRGLELALREGSLQIGLGQESRHSSFWAFALHL